MLFCTFRFPFKCTRKKKAGSATGLQCIVTRAMVHSISHYYYKVFGSIKELQGRNRTNYSSHYITLVPGCHYEVVIPRQLHVGTSLTIKITPLRADTTVVFMCEEWLKTKRWKLIWSDGSHRFGMMKLKPAYNKNTARLVWMVAISAVAIQTIWEGIVFLLGVKNGEGI